jgi:hypothetical protein
VTFTGVAFVETVIVPSSGTTSAQVCETVAANWLDIV